MDSDPYATQRRWDQKRLIHHQYCDDCTAPSCEGNRHCCPKCPWNTDLHG